MISRRTFLKRTAYAAGAATLGSVYPVFIEPYQPVVTRLRLPIQNLPPAFDGLTIAHMTDLHRSPFVSLEYLNHGIDVANELQPDVTVFTGDYVTHGIRLRNRIVNRDINVGDPRRYSRECAGCMARSRAKYGVFASLGNHDHWFDGDVVSDAIQSAGVRVLRNENTTVMINGGSLPIVGLGDLYTEGVDLDRAFRTLPRSGTAAGVPSAPSSFSLVLSHNPDVFKNWSLPGSHLILAGHTHGGQIRLPLLGAPMSPSRYTQGLFRAGDSMMYVNRGLGLICPPVRLNCPPEIAFIQLQRV